ncbi:MAG: amidohydrolase family protein [Fimbriimonadaceae bacterium]|nr:amidohydrolase family protein [Fimbriimonadaceae bacterium]
MKLKRLPVLALLATLPLIAIAQDSPRPTYLLKGARVIVSPGKVIEKADILVKDGVIAKIGNNLEASGGAETIDCSGLSVYPGLIHPLLRVTVEGVTQTPTAGQVGPGGGGGRTQVNRDADPFGKAVNLFSDKRIAEMGQKGVSDFESLVKNGYAVAHTYARGGLVGPKSGIFSLSSPDIAPANMMREGLGFPISLAAPRNGQYPGSTMGAIAFIRQTILDAGWYGRMQSYYAANPNVARPERDLALERLVALAKGEDYALFDDMSELSALEAMAISREFNLKSIYTMRRSAGAILDLLKNPRIQVMLDGDLISKPTISPDDSRNDVANIRAYFNELQAGAELEKAGIEFCYAPSSSSNPFEGIRMLVRCGLSRDGALAAMTTRPAKLLGIDKRVGTVEEGKLGNLLIVQGDLLSQSSQIMAAFVEGQRVAFDMPKKKEADQLGPEAPMKLMPPNYESFPRPAETKKAFRLYKNATIWTMSRQGVLQNADIIIKDGKIAAIGKGLTAPDGCEVIDAKGLHISPGLWDCHSHTAITGSVNESTNMITAECRIQDVVNHRDVNVYRQLAGGVVGAQQLHGSANVIGGQANPVKWRWGQRPEDFRIDYAPMGVKFALGQNPIREPEGGFGGNQAPEPSWDSLLTWRPQSRMGNEDSIRRAFYAGKEYAQAWADFKAGKTKVEPRRDLQLEALSMIADGTIKIHSHGYRQDEFLMLMRVAKEVGAEIATFQHILEGYKIADEMAEQGIGGSTFADWWGFKLEAYDAIPYNMSLMADRGVVTSVNSDSNNHARRLYIEAAKAIRYGASTPEASLSFVTTGPAKQMGISGRTGSLEAGKDADLAIWTAPPTSIFTKCLATYVDGVKLFDLADDAKQRAERDAFLATAKQVLGQDEPPKAAEAAAAGELTAGETAKVSGIGEVTGIPGIAKYQAKAFAIVGATIHPMIGDPFVGNVVVGDDGLIKAVGPRAAIPNGVTRIDGKGKHVYPGLIDASTTLGLNEIGQVPASNDSSERGNFHPDYRPERAVNPESELLGVARAQGVLTAVTHPTGGGMPGQASLIYLDGYTWEDMTIQGGIGVMLTVGGGGGFGFGEDEDLCGEEHFGAGSAVKHSHDEHEDDKGGQGRRGGGGGGDTTSSLRQASTWLQQARDYIEARNAYASGKGPLTPRDDRMEQLAKVLDKKCSILAIAHSASDMKATVAWAEKEGVNIQLLGCTNAVEIADWLAEKGIPIIFTATMNLPGGNDSHPHEFYAAPGKLRAAGVKVALSTNSDFDVRQLRDQAGFAAAYGMDPEDAMRSVTLWPAEILGLGKRLGAIQTGYEGTLIVTDGDLLETSTRVLHAWIRGKETSLENKQTRLYNKYNTKPKPNTWKKAG